jgi:hypothetical protein
MSVIPSLTILSEEQKFNGDNLLLWNIYITQLLGAKGLLGYINGKIPKPSESQPPTTPDITATATTGTPIYSTTPTLDEWTFRDQVTRGHITLNCTDVASLGVITTGTAKDAYDSIQNEWGKSTDMRRSHAQEALNRTEYAEGTDIQEHIKLLRTRKAAVDNLTSSVMSDETWRGIIIRSIPPTANWLPVIPSLYTMTTSADVISTLSAHGMILARYTTTNIGASSSNTALAAQTTNSDSEGCTNPDCKAKIRSTHTTANCYWPGGGKEGQFPPDFGTRSRASVATSNPEQTRHFALSARVWNTPSLRRSGILFSTSTHYYSSDPIKTSTRQPNYIASTLPTTDKTLPTNTSLINTEHFGRSGILIDDSTNHHPTSLPQSFGRRRMPTVRSDSLFTTRKPAAYPSLTPHTDSLANHFTQVEPDLDNAIINDGHHIDRELDITDISDTAYRSTPQCPHRTSASVGEQLLTPLTVVTEPDSEPITPLTIVTEPDSELEPITLPTHKARRRLTQARFTGTTLLGNTTTSSNPIIINQHIIRHHINQLINNNFKSLAAVDHHWHHDIIMINHHKPGTVDVTAAMPVIPVTAVITVKSLQAGIRHRSTEDGQRETMGKVRVEGQLEDWATTANNNPTSGSKVTVQPEVQRIKDLGETLAVWWISIETGDFKLETDNNFVDKPQVYNPPHTVLRFNMTTLASTAARTILLLSRYHSPLPVAPGPYHSPGNSELTTRSWTT